MFRNDSVHLLQEKVPFLFNVPSAADARLGLSSSFALVFAAILWIAVSGSFNRGEFYYLPIVLLVFHAYVTVRLAKNLLFLFRYGLISVIGIGAALAWSFKDTILIAPFGAHYQTHDATVALVGSVMLAVAGTSIGWFAVFRRQLVFKPAANLRMPSGIRFGRSAAILFAFLVVAILVFKAGGLVSSEKAYTSGTNDLGFEFGAFNGILFFCTSAFLLASRLLQYPARQTLVTLLILYTLPILTGSRADFLMQIAIIVFVLLRADSRRLRQQSRVPLLKLVFGIITLYFLAQYIGVWRHVGDFGLAFQIFLDSWSLFSERSSGVVLSLSTGNQMASHFYAVHAKTSYLSEPFLFGSSYFDFLLRTPPGFLGLPRPLDLAWQMDVAGERMAQGGIFEVAEAYWNFWYFGAFFVPLVITYLMGSLLRYALRSTTAWLFAAISFITIMLMTPRGVWYQTFAYWRTVTVIVVLYLIIKLAHGLISSNRARAGKKVRFSHS